MPSLPFLRKRAGLIQRNVPIPEHVIQCVGSVSKSGRRYWKMAAAHVIVVAPDVAFRHSLVFVLESSGFTVLSYGSIEAAFASPQVRDAGCAVVDEEAIDSWQVAQELFKAFARPVILLMSFLRATPKAPAVRYLAKPFLGKPLLDAVQEAIAEKFGPAT